MSEHETSGAEETVWILVDHSSREAAFSEVARVLREDGTAVEIVTITEMFSQVAREALTGGAERLLRGLRVAVRGRSADEDLIGAVRRARPDVLAVTDARYVRALSLLESLTGIDSLQLGVFPDYNFSPAWLRSGLHGVIVPHEALRERLGREGLDPELILVAGPAISAGFTREIDKEAERQALGLGGPVVLVRADTFPTGLIEKIVFQSTLIDSKPQVIFHHNSDNAAAAQLRRAADQYRLRAVMFGKVDDFERYVAAADIVIADPHEPLMPELLAAGRPLVLVGEAGDTIDQVDFLRNEGVARYVPDVLRLGAELDRVLAEATLAEMTKAASEVGLRSGSREVAEALKTALEQRDHWRQREMPPPPDGDDQAPPQDEGQATTGGPFESIGSTGGGGQQARREEGSSGAGRDEGSRGRPEQDYSRISRAEAKEQLAALILSERELERKLGELERQQDRWRNRLELAREWNEADLAREAEDILRGYLDEARPLQEELADIRRQKDKLKRAAGAPAGASGSGASSGSGSGSRLNEIEERFRKMELKSDLDGLKDRIRREMGEDDDEV